jgi:hypothetical protein
MLPVLVWTCIAPLAQAADTPEKCRQVTEHMMKGDIAAATAAMDAVPSKREQLHNSLTRLTYTLVGFVKGKKPRLERTLPDTEVEGNPISVQIWSFGDRDVYLVGCMLRGKKETVHIDLQVRSTADEIEQEFRRILKESRA